MTALTALDLFEIYKAGSFPMADDAMDQDFYIVTPKRRGLLPLPTLHISKSLEKQVRKFPFEIRINHDFKNMITECAAPTLDRPETWINPAIRDLFIELHELGLAHSVECYTNGILTGGLYGLAVGGVFCGESMFSRQSNASKIALVHLCARLSRAGFKLLDAQFFNPHLAQFGLYEIDQSEYLAQLDKLKDIKPVFHFETDEKKLVLDYLNERKTHENHSI